MINIFFKLTVQYVYAQELRRFHFEVMGMSQYNLFYCFKYFFIMRHNFKDIKTLCCKAFSCKQKQHKKTQKATSK